MELAIAERRYSSWSLRGHLLLELTGAPFATRQARLGSPDFEALRAEFHPARTVPMLRFADGDPGGAGWCWDSLALAEELASRFPAAPIWPQDPAARAAARSVSAEMHSGFPALRGACPMNLGRVYAGFEAPGAVLADVARIEALWTWARQRFGGAGPFLFGAAPCAADAIYAPVASRFATYGLARAARSADYMATIFGWGAFRRWRAMAEAEAHRVPDYEFDLPDAPRFGPVPRPARAVAGGSLVPVNAACPYSGKPVAADSLAEIDGRVIGFCNPFCRDKSVADAEAWPKLAPLLP